VETRLANFYARHDPSKSADDLAVMVQWTAANGVGAVNEKLAAKYGEDLDAPKQKPVFNAVRAICAGQGLPTAAVEDVAWAAVFDGVDAKQVDVEYVAAALDRRAKAGVVDDNPSYAVPAVAVAVQAYAAYGAPQPGYPGPPAAYPGYAGAPVVVHITQQHGPVVVVTKTSPRNGCLEALGCLVVLDCACLCLTCGMCGCCC